MTVEEIKTDNNDEDNPTKDYGYLGSADYPADDGTTIRIPNDFNIEYVKLYPWDGSEPIDLTNVRVQINIFEDIFNNFVTGNISVVDSWDLATLYPLIGEERLEISFYRQGTKEQADENPLYENQAYQTVRETERYKMDFRVVKMTERKLERDKAQYYVLHFVSPELISTKKQKVRLAFKKMLYSEMVGSIYGKYFNSGKNIEIENTMYEQDFCISNWTPAQSINIICSRSIPKGRMGSNYVFFETIHGFNFTSLERLFESEPKETILYQVTNWNVSPSNKRIEEDVRNVHEYDFVDYFDVVSNLQHGMYASKLMTYDLVRKRCFEYDFDYMKQFKNQKHLENNTLCSDKLDALGEPYMARFNLMGTNKEHDTLPWISNREPGIMPMRIEEYVLQRQSQFQQMQNVRMSVTLPGNPERQAGDTIDFALPNAMGWPNKYSDEPERYLSGKYIITAVRHRIERNAYAQDLEIVKDSFLNEIEYIDPVPLYKDSW